MAQRTSKKNLTKGAFGRQGAKKNNIVPVVVHEQPEKHSIWKRIWLWITGRNNAKS